MKVGKCFDHLFKEMSTYWFSEISGSLNVVKEFMSINSLLYYISDYFLLAVRLIEKLIGVKTVILADVLVVQVGSEFIFILQVSS